jgi:hypothetical protein
MAIAPLFHRIRQPAFVSEGRPKGYHVSTILQGAGRRVLLVEMMHKPGIDEKAINLGRQIVQTPRPAE